jgi:hypothetical protein
MGITACESHNIVSLGTQNVSGFLGLLVAHVQGNRVQSLHKTGSSEIPIAGGDDWLDTQKATLIPRHCPCAQVYAHQSQQLV